LTKLGHRNPLQLATNRQTDIPENNDGLNF